ncbi:MAG: hypothetical protein AABX38_04575 [Candidatus Micrarchaeota archaeon]
MVTFRKKLVKVVLAIALVSTTTLKLPIVEAKWKLPEGGANREKRSSTYTGNSKVKNGFEFEYNHMVTLTREMYLQQVEEEFKKIKGNPKILALVRKLYDNRIKREAEAIDGETVEHLDMIYSVASITASMKVSAEELKGRTTPKQRKFLQENFGKGIFGLIEDEDMILLVTRFSTRILQRIKDEFPNTQLNYEEIVEFARDLENPLRKKEKKETYKI